MLFETKNWKDRFAKGLLHHAQNALGIKNKLQRGPWPEVGEGAGGAGQFPAVSLAGGEGNGVEEQERTELYPMVVLLGLGVAGLGVPRGAVAPAVTASGGGGVPVR